MILRTYYQPVCLIVVVMKISMAPVPKKADDAEGSPEKRTTAKQDEVGTQDNGSSYPPEVVSWLEDLLQKVPTFESSAGSSTGIYCLIYNNRNYNSAVLFFRTGRYRTYYSQNNPTHLIAGYVFGDGCEICFCDLPDDFFD